MTRQICTAPSFRTVAAVASLAVLAVGLWLARASHAESASASISASTAASAPPALRVTDAQWSSLEIRTVATVPFRTLAEADAVIAVDDRVTVPIFSPATGRVASVVAEPGEFVRRGQALASIDGIETAQAVSDLAAATAQARTAEQQLALAREVAARQQGLVAAGGGAAKDWHQSQSDLIAAEGAEHIAEATLAAARVKASSVGADVSASAGTLGATHLVSPIDGEVIQRQVSTGQFVSSLAAGGQAPLFTISDLRHVWVVGSLGERDGALLRAGQAVEVSTIAGGAHRLKAVVNWVAPIVDPQTRRILFRAELANLDLALKPQMTAHVRIFDPSVAPTVVIPALAIVRDGGEAHCYVAAASHVLTLRRLTLGRTEGGLTQVLSGLKPGERIVARGAIFVDALAEGAGS